LSTWKPPKQVKKNTDEYYRDSLRDNGQAPVKGAFLIDGAGAGGLHLLGSVALCGKTSELEIWHGFLLMWAVCTGVIHGVGFRPRAIHWQGIFCPLIADIVLVLGLFFFFF
jgi:cyd operon protein YbgE